MMSVRRPTIAHRSTARQIEVEREEEREEERERTSENEIGWRKDFKDGNIAESTNCAGFDTPFS